jgi:tricorn protease
MLRIRTSLVLAAVAACALAFAAPAAAQVDARMLRFADVSDTHIAFVYAGDIWIVDKEGGVAQRLSTPSGEEQFPRFSPDGSQIAFTGNYDGNTDVYAVPTLGGQVRRLTHHPMADRILGWYPDGQSVLIASQMESEKERFSKFFKVNATGGLPERLPVPYGEFGAISPDATQIAYTPRSRDFRTWKRYRGGMAPEIWLFNLNDNSSRNISDSDANDGHPMWHGDTVYFLSDRDDNKRNNVWAYDLNDGTTRQITEFTDFDVRFPAIGGGDIVFEAGGRLYLLDLDTEQVREVQVDVVTDRSTLKPRSERVAGDIAWGDISPSGARVVLEARGDLFTVPAENGITRNLTRTSGVAERSPMWSPDGRWIAYFSDASGEYELTVRAADGSGEERTLTELGEGFRYHPYWSPDSKKIAFIDQAEVIQIYDFDTGAVTTVDEGMWMMHGATGWRPGWSSDSRWLAYSRGLMNRHNAIFLFDTDSGQRHQVTSGFYSETNPAFDPDGKYLYVLTNRSLSPSYGDIDNSFIYANSTNVAAIPLRVDVPSPLAPRNDEEEVAEDEDEGDSATDADTDAGGDDGESDDDDGEAEEDAGLQIDLDGFEQRLVVLPAEPGNYADLRAVSGKVIYHRAPRTGASGRTFPLVMWDLEDREEATILDNVSGFEISANGKKVLAIAGGRFAIVSVGPGQKMAEALDLSNMEVTVDPVAEWRQIFNDVWRLFRDYFYVANMHGVDWQAMGERYSGLLDDVVTRWDLDFIIGELIGELNVGHSYNRGGGDTESSARRNVGLLGVDLAVENGAYRIANIIDGAVWDSEVRSPLAMPGLGVAEGDYLLAINGTPLDTGVDPWAALQGTAGETVELTVNGEPAMDGSRTVLVETLNVGQEMRLRNLAWIDANRRRVEEATDGRVGYVFVPSTGIDGQTELVRQWAAQMDKQALIIDERFNNGGQIPDRFIELLNRPLYSYWGVRDGQDWQWPPVAHIGPKVMLMNGWSGSGGDALPFFFREAGLGPLIGTRTWGGLVGISGVPQLIDGGNIAVPTFGIYSTEGEWIIEGYGVDPDIEVKEDPTQLANGVDPQLEAGITEILRLLQENPVVRPAQPAAPDRSQ